EYVETVEFMRVEGTNCLTVGLVVSGKQFCVMLDSEGKNTAIQSVEGKWNNPDATLKGRLVDDNRLHQLYFIVKKDMLQISFDGVPIMRWKNPEYGKIENPLVWDAPSSEHLYIGSWETSWKITKLDVTPINGMGNVGRTWHGK